MSVIATAFRGAVWNVALGLVTRLAGVVGTLALTYFLSPLESGQVGAAAILALTAAQLANVGLGQYIMAKPDAGRDVAFHATVYNAAIGLAILGGLVLARHPLGAWFGGGDTARFIPGFALASFLDCLALIPERVLYRDLRFRTVALARGAADLTYTGLSLALAAAGWGGMAIVAGNVARSSARLVAYVSLVDRRDWLTPAPLRRRPTADLFRFGLPLGIAAFVYFAASRWDNLLFVHLFGAAQMGLYNLAYNLADIPATNVGEHAGAVLIPSLARARREDRARLFTVFLSMVALVVFPLALGLGAVAVPLVDALFPAEWRGLAPMLTVLCLVSVFRPIGWMLTSFWQVQLHTGVILWLELGRTAAVLGAVVVLGHFGAVWACVGVDLALGAAAFAGILLARRLDGVRLAPVLRAVGQPLLACVPMVAAAAAVAAAARGAGLAAGVALAAGIVAGAAVYVPAAFLVARRPARDLVEQGRALLARRREAA